MSNLGTGGSAFDATLYNSPTVSTSDKKVGSAAMAFVSSSSQYIQIPALTIGSSGLSFAFWFKSSSSVDWARVFDFGNTPPGVDTSNNNVYFAIKSNDVDINSFPPVTDPYHQSGIFKQNVNDGVWRHAVWTIDVSGNWLVYLNGALVCTFNSIVYPPVMSRAYNYLGKSGWASDPYLNGAIDEFYMFYSVLSASQVTALYTMMVPTSTPTSRPSSLPSAQPSSLPSAAPTTGETRVLRVEMIAAYRLLPS